MRPEVKQCRNCQQFFKVEEGVEDMFAGFDEGDLCYDCEQLLVFLRLTPDAQQAVEEHIYNQRIIAGMRAIREELRGQGLKVEFHIGTVLFHWRYQRLKALTPNRFQYSDEQYWNGFYS